MVMPRSRSRSMESSTCSIISRCAERAGDFEQTVGKRRFAVIDVRNDREIADVSWIHAVDTEAVELQYPMDSNRFDTNISARGFRFAIIVARFNEFVTEKLLEGALDALRGAGAEEPDVVTERVPGAWELPLTAQCLAESHNYDAIICLGAVIRGDTPHFDYVAGECARGLQRVQLDMGMPVVFGVLTTDNVEQAQERTGGKHGNKGFDAAKTAIEMAVLMKRIRPGG